MNFLDFLLSQKGSNLFNILPSRIFLDTNVLQYLQDFDEYIFENYREHEDRFEIIKNRQVSFIEKGERLFGEIEHLWCFASCL